MKNNIPQGYKASPLGIIPQEWEVKRFKDVGNFLRNNTLPRDKMSESEGCVQNIHYGDVLVKYREILKVSKANIPWIVENSKDSPLGDMLQNGDIVISDTAEDYTVGKATELMEIDGVSVVAGLHTMPFHPLSDLFSPCFLGYYINSMAYRFQLYALIQGIKVCAISKKAIGGTFLIVPPLAEQRKIAEVLGLWDKAIEKQSQLIEQLTLRKRGLMQQLLTAKRRLPGFSGPWKVCVIQQLFTPVTTVNDGKPHLPMTISAKLGLISQQNKFDRVIAGDSLEKYTLIRYGDFAYNKGNSNLYEMGCIYQLKEESALVPFVYICFRAKEFVCGDFYRQYFLNHGLDRQLKRIITSGARGDGLLNVDKKDFFSLQIMYPSFEEQTAIAQVLTAADREIELAQQKLELLRQQKRGLMQQLLTGKKRVKI